MRSLFLMARLRKIQDCVLKKMLFVFNHVDKQETHLQVLKFTQKYFAII